MSRRRDTGIPAVQPVQLTDAAAKAFLRYQRATEKAKKLRRAEEDARSAAEELGKAFGDAPLGQMPDGELIVRTEEPRHYKPLPAREFTVVKFHALPTWDR